MPNNFIIEAFNLLNVFLVFALYFCSKEIISTMLSTLSPINQVLDFLPVNDLNLYAELGNKAGEEGKMDESLAWYMKGLSKARELNNSTKISEFSGLIFTLL